MRFVQAQKHRQQASSSAARFLCSLAATPFLADLEPVGPPISFGLRIGLAFSARSEKGADRRKRIRAQRWRSASEVLIGGKGPKIA